jgi:hypothetical protein
MVRVVDAAHAAAADISRSGDGIISVDLPRGAAFTDEVAVSTSSRLQVLSGGQPCRVLMRLKGVASISRMARSMLGRQTNASAIALVGESPVDRVIANFVLGAEPSECPVRYFDSEPQALEWLERDNAA